MGNIKAPRVHVFRNHIKMYNLNEIKNSFSKHFQNHDFIIRNPEPLIPREDSTLWFTNSAICTLKSEMRSNKDLENNYAVIQPCIRTRDLFEKCEHEYMYMFNMLGAFVKAGDYPKLCKLVKSWFSEIGLTNDRIAIDAASWQMALVKPWIDNNLFSITMNSRSEEEYKWRFGVNGICGSGLTIKLRNEGSGQWLDIGNLMEVRSSANSVIAYGFGVGVETLWAKLNNEVRAIDSIIPRRATNYPVRRAVDLFRLVATLRLAGVSKGRKGREKISKVATRELFLALDTCYLDNANWRNTIQFSKSCLDCSVVDEVVAEYVLDRDQRSSFIDFSFRAPIDVKFEQIRQHFVKNLSQNKIHVSSISLIEELSYWNTPKSAREREAMLETDLKYLIRIYFLRFNMFSNKFNSPAGMAKILQESLLDIMHEK